MKDFYAVLGVTPLAEEVVIKAAYRALAQRYHPDRFSGSIEDANRLMNVINEAYATLSDPVKRSAYDDMRRQADCSENNYDAGDEAADEGVQQLENDWVIAIEFYPDLVEIEADLAKTSSSLAFTFRLMMVSEKRFRDRRELARTLLHSFLTTYFGEDPEIIRFAKYLIYIGRKDAAKALNNAIRVLGADLEADTVINRIVDKFRIIDAPGLDKKAKVPYSIFQAATRPDATIDDIRKVVDATGGDFRVAGTRIAISWNGTGGEFRNRHEIVNWFNSYVRPHITHS